MYSLFFILYVAIYYIHIAKHPNSFFASVGELHSKNITEHVDSSLS